MKVIPRSLRRWSVPLAGCAVLLSMAVVPASASAADASAGVTIVRQQGNSPTTLSAFQGDMQVQSRGPMPGEQVWDNRYYSYNSCQNAAAYIRRTHYWVASTRCSNSPEWNGTAYRYVLYYRHACYDRTNTGALTSTSTQSRA